MAFWERMEKVINQGLEASREMLGKAKDKAKEMGEKGILKFEIMQLEKQAEKCFVTIGKTVAELLESNDNITLPADSSVVTNLLKEVHDIKEKIDDKEEKLKNL